jgi:glycerol-3-phosphate acyltransferase PlsY
MEILLAVTGYLLGSILPAEGFFRWFKNRSSLEMGEKPSTKAVWKQVGKWQGVVCLIIDIGKGFLTPFLAVYVLKVNLSWLPLIAAAPVAGHSWPFLRWEKGGWGLASTAGSLLGIGGWTGFAGLLGVPMIFFFKKTPGPALAAVAFPAILILMAITHKPWQVLVSALVVMVVVMVRRFTGEPKRSPNPSQPRQ